MKRPGEKYIHSEKGNYKAVLRIFEREIVEKSENSGDKAKKSVEKEELFHKK